MKTSEKIVAMAKLALASYDDERDVTAGFKPISAQDFDMGAKAPSGSDVNWTFKNGTYRATLPGKLSASFKDDAVATVSLNKDANGVETLAVAFRGTDGAAVDKALGWGPQMKKGYYPLYEPLIDAIKAYAQEHAIRSVLVTGHSLGAAMAQYAMQDLTDTKTTKYSAAIFGSPGAVNSGDNAENRMLEFEYSQDVFTRLKDAPFVSFDHQGQRIVMPLDDTKTSRDNDVSLYEHKMELYLKAVQNFAALGSDLPSFMKTDTHKGNGEARAFAGGSGNDSLKGQSSAETLYGGAGNDTLNGLGGNDALRGGTGDDRLFGSTGNDYASGSSGSDWLNGGAGKDVLRGGAGDDTFAFNQQLLKANVDTIVDFISADDRIALDDAVFTALDKGYLQKTDFADHISYSKKTGKVFYNSDGDGGASAKHFVTITPGANVSADDFWVY
jgi:pimeloyl-ACP methyl ester carboxylesterase